MPRSFAIRPRAALALISAAALSCGLGAGASTVASAAPTAQAPGERAKQVPDRPVPDRLVPRITWGSCGPQLEAFQCATVEVPTDYDRPYGPTTTIGLTRLPASTVARQTLDALKKAPRVIALPDGTSITVRYSDAVAGVFFALYDPTQWTALGDYLTLLSGRGTAAVSTQDRQSVAALLRRGEDYASAGTTLGTLCADVRPTSVGRYPAAADRQDRRFPDFGRFRVWIDLPCTYLRQEGIRDSDAYVGPWRQSTKAQVLVIGTRFDPATPYKNTRPYANLFRNASLLTMNGWGHTTLARSACVDEKFTAYLLDPGRRQADATCQPDAAAVPFSTAATQQLRSTTEPARALRDRPAWTPGLG